MLDNVTFGQYYPINSLIHKLDSRIKLVLTIGLIVVIFMADNFISLGLMFLSTVFVMILSKIPIKMYLKSLKTIWFFILLTAVINIFFIKTGDLLVEFWKIQIYTDGVKKAIFIAIRIFLLLIISSALTYTTTPTSLTDAIESLLKPLSKIGINTHTFAMMMSIALRFIPTLVEETEKIMNAQKSRGADFSSGGLIKRAKSLIPILIPLFVSSFKRAEELAVAMESRCYRGDKNRTKLVKLQFRGVDVAFFALTLFFLAALLSLVILPYKLGLSGLVFDIMFYRV